MIGLKRRAGATSDGSEVAAGPNTGPLGSNSGP